MVIWGEATNDNNNSTEVDHYGVFAKNIAKFSEVEKGEVLDDTVLLGSDASDFSRTFTFKAILDALKAALAPEDGKYKIEIPGKNGNGSSVLLWNSGDGRLRIQLKDENGQTCEMVLSAEAESSCISIWGVQTTEEDESVATRGFVEDAIEGAIQEAITGAIEGEY